MESENAPRTVAAPRAAFGHGRPWQIVNGDKNTTVRHRPYGGVRKWKVWVKGGGGMHRGPSSSSGRRSDVESRDEMWYGKEKSKQE
eukprot:gene16828-biopygen11336